MNKKLERLIAAIEANPTPFDTPAGNLFEVEFSKEIRAVGGIAVKDGWPILECMEETITSRRQLRLSQQARTGHILCKSIK